jgi:hypothetical protein
LITESSSSVRDHSRRLERDDFQSFDRFGSNSFARARACGTARVVSQQILNHVVSESGVRGIER